MTLKRKIWNCYTKTICNFFVFRKRRNCNFSLDIPPPLCLISIAFNNVFLIEEQIRLVKKNIIDSNFTYIVCDNSSEKKKRGAIKSICTKENIPYYSLPFNWFSKIHKQPSYSHGLAMNWIYYNIVVKMKPDVFGFIDHDIFPIKPYSVLQKIKHQDFYGKLNNRTPDNHCRFIWYLWAGFCFFKFESIKNLNINFMPCKIDGVFLDTAGSNYSILYSKYHMEQLHFTDPVIEFFIRDGNIYHSDILHFIDNDWLHTINGSNWAKIKGKDEFLREFLKQY